jgi:hypothetical protein
METLSLGNRRDRLAALRKRLALYADASVMDALRRATDANIDDGRLALAECSPSDAVHYLIAADFARQPDHPDTRLLLSAVQSLPVFWGNPREYRVSRI